MAGERRYDRVEKERASQNRGDQKQRDLITGVGCKRKQDALSQNPPGKEPARVTDKQEW